MVNFSIPENFTAFENLRCEISFISVTVPGSMVKFSRELHRNTRNVRFFHAEVSDLSQFPCLIFDICITHWVSNHPAHTVIGFKELLGITKVATVSHICINQGGPAIGLTHASVG